MEKSTIIKLRQAEANEVDINGSYKVSLAQGINLEEGDEVRVHSVILDTATESVVVLLLVILFIRLLLLDPLCLT